MSAAAEVVSKNTYGSVLRSHRFDGLTVEEVVMPPALAVPVHAHDGAQIYFVLEGRYAEGVRGARHLFAPGHAWFRSPREPHENAVVGSVPALTLIVTIAEHRLNSAARASAAPLPSAALEDLRAAIVREMASGDECARTALEGWSLLLLSRAERLLVADDVEIPEWYADAVEFVRGHFRECISLERVAAHAGVHPATLATAFRRFGATSVGDCIRELRLEYAHDELLRTRRPLKEIALDAGFYDQAHFGRWFRRRFGVSPGEVRRG